MIVKFNSTEEYLDEVTKNVPLIHLDILRITRRAQFTSSYPVRRLFITATHVVKGDIIRLDRYIGDLVGTKKEDDALYRKADAIMNSLEKQAKALGLETRAGLYENPD